MVTRSHARAQPAADPFRAMGDPTRRQILRALLEGPAPVNRIAERFDCTRPAISRHLRVLKDARLVRQEKSGREILYHLEPLALAELRAWLDLFWSRGLARIRKAAEGRRK